MQVVGLPEHVMQGEVHPTHDPASRNLVVSRQERQKADEEQVEHGFTQGWQTLVVLSGYVVLTQEVEQVLP